MQLKFKVLDFHQTERKQDHEFLIRFSSVKTNLENNVQQSSLDSYRNNPNFQQKYQTLNNFNDELLINIQNPEEQNKIYIQFFSKDKNSLSIQYQGFSQIDLRKIYPLILTQTYQKIQLSSQFLGINGQREKVKFQVYFIEAKQEIKDNYNCSISIYQNLHQKILTRTHSQKGQNNFKNNSQQQNQSEQTMQNPIIKEENKLKKRWLMNPNEVITEQVYMENLNDSLSQKEQINLAVSNLKDNENISTSGSQKLVNSRKKKTNFLKQKFKLIKYMHELQINNSIMMELQRRIDENSQ